MCVLFFEVMDSHAPKFLFLSCLLPFPEQFSKTPQASILSFADPNNEAHNPGLAGAYVYTPHTHTHDTCTVHMCASMFVYKNVASNTKPCT